MGLGTEVGRDPRAVLRVGGPCEGPGDRARGDWLRGGHRAGTDLAAVQ